MAGDHCRDSGDILSSEVHVNKKFIDNANYWTCLRTLQFGSEVNGQQMYNSSQYPGYANSYPPYGGYGAEYSYQGYTYQTDQPAPPGESYVNNAWTPAQSYSEPPPPPQKEVKNDAVAQEMEQQKAQLISQREDYVRKASVMRRELDQLKQQKQELTSDGRSERDLKMVLRENERLQNEIQNKLKAILNVIEMLSSIIKDGKSVTDLEEQLNQKSSTPLPWGNGETSQSSGQKGYEQDPEDDKRFCYVYYDTGLHWCRTCDKFPETAKEFLQHLQSKEHQGAAKENDIDTTPWHKLPVEPVLPSYDDAPKKRVPIKGLQFFISAPSWYCKLCDIWIGDLHCASHHLKSQAHAQNYENFIEQNPQWEMDWLKDREKSLSRNVKQDSSDSEDDKKKRKRKLDSLLREKKKKKRRSKKKKKQQSSDSSSSSSSSDSSSDDEADKSRSIRVAMRNRPQLKSILNEDLSSTWGVLDKLIQEHRKKEVVKEKEKEKEKPKEPEDELISQWMTVVEPPVKEKYMLDSLKDRMRAKQEVEKARFVEIEKKRIEKERQEREMMERQKQQEREEAERQEKERIRREQEEFQRITDKERNQVRFKPVPRENYRRRPSPSRSDEEREEAKAKEEYKRPSPHRYRRDSEQSRSSREDKRKSRSPDRSHDRKSDSGGKKKPPGPPSYKKLPFIGRMPLFKNKKNDEKPIEKEIKKEEYEPQRKTRFESGNLARAFIPQPDVVCFPVLSSIPPLTIPPPPKVEEIQPAPPAPPQINEKKAPAAPPPPKIGDSEKKNSNNIDEDNLYSENGPEMDPNIMGQYYQDYSNMMYSQQYREEEHTPLEPPPLPPDDDLAMLGICADDMAAQSF